MIKLIIFDFDGVLIDSIHNMEYAWQLSCKKCDIKVHFSKYKKFIGLPFFEILKKLKIDKDKFNNICKFYNYYSFEKINLVKIKKKDLKILKNLKNKGYILGLFTSKNMKRSFQILGKNKELFKYKIFPNKNSRGKPYPDGLNKIINKSKIKKSETVYLGDTIFDYRSANSANIQYIHANWGYQKIRKKNVFKINELSELKNFLENESKF